MSKLSTLIACVFFMLNQSLAQTSAPDNNYWWPNQLSLEPLNTEASHLNPMGGDFSYREAYESLDMDALRQDLIDLMTTSQEWLSLIHI